MFVRIPTAIASIDSFLRAVVGQAIVTAGVLSADVLLPSDMIGRHTLQSPSPLPWLRAVCGVAITGRDNQGKGALTCQEVTVVITVIFVIFVDRDGASSIQNSALTRGLTVTSSHQVMRTCSAIPSGHHAPAYESP